MQKETQMRFYHNSFEAIHGRYIEMKYMQEWVVGDRDMKSPHRHMGPKGMFLGPKYRENEKTHHQALVHARRVLHG